MEGWAALGDPKWYIKVCKLRATQWKRYGTVSKDKRDVKVVVNVVLHGLGNSGILGKA